MLELLNATTDDRLIGAFARRLDARAEWNAMKAEAEKREDKTLFQKMVNAEEARRVLGESVLWRSGVNRALRVLLDAAAWSGLGYLGYQLLDDDDEAADSEADKLLEDSQRVIQYLENDPEGRELLRRYRESRK